MPIFGWGASDPVSRFLHHTIFRFRFLHLKKKHLVKHQYQYYSIFSAKCDQFPFIWIESNLFRFVFIFEFLFFCENRFRILPFLCHTHTITKRKRKICDSIKLFPYIWPKRKLGRFFLSMHELLSRYSNLKLSFSTLHLLIGPNDQMHSIHFGVW